MDTSEYIGDSNWVTYLDSELVDYKVENKTIWLNNEPSNNEKDNHNICGQFMDGRIDDSVSLN